MKKNQKKLETKRITANEETNVRDIIKSTIYTKDGYLIRFLRLYTINVELLSDSERESMCGILTGAFKGEKEGFSILSIPRTVDMEEYINYLNSRHEEEIESPGRKKVLAEMMREATKKVLSGSNYEHQYFLEIWEPEGAMAEKKLEDRVFVMEQRYQSIQIPTSRLNDTELLKLCNLYTNSNTALIENYDDSYTPIIPWIKKEGGN